MNLYLDLEYYLYVKSFQPLELHLNQLQSQTVFKTGHNDEGFDLTEVLDDTTYSHTVTLYSYCSDFSIKVSLAPNLICRFYFKYD